MAVVVESSGTQVAVIGTEHTLAAPATAKTRQLVVDLSALAAGEVVELRVKRPALAAGAVGTWTSAVFRGVVSDPVVLSVPCPSPHGATFTLRQTSGAGRSFPWSVETLD